jgi:microcompartment protein CcmK/EutM
MQLGRIVGTATSTVKHRSLAGWKLLVVQMLMADGQSPDGEPVLAVDRLGAGPGDVVLLTSDGKGTRSLLNDNNTPVRWSTLGLRDA